MHQAEEDTGDDHTGGDTEVFCKERVQVATKDGFFNERCHQNGHGHKEYCRVFVAEKLFDRHILWRLHFGGNDKDHDGKTAARKEEEPGTTRTAAVGARDSSPA